MPLTATAGFTCRRLEPRPGGDVLFEAYLTGYARRPRLTEPELLARRVLPMPRAPNLHQPQARSPVCSTRTMDTADPGAIGGRPVRLSANSLRPERRSTDGQVILEAISD